MDDLLIMHITLNSYKDSKGIEHFTTWCGLDSRKNWGTAMSPLLFASDVLVDGDGTKVYRGCKRCMSAIRSAVADIEKKDGVI